MSVNNFCRWCQTFPMNALPLAIIPLYLVPLFALAHFATLAQALRRDHRA